MAQSAPELSARENPVYAATPSLISALSLPLIASAQDPREVLSPGAPAITGAPFSAKLVSTNYQKLPDGTSITKEDVVWLARDSQGRTWSRRIISNSKDPLQRTGKEFEVVSVYDPTTGKHINWCDCNRVAWVRQFGPPRPMPIHNHPGPGGMDVLLGPYADRLKFHLEGLPDQYLEGVKTTVTKATRIVKAGTDGNDRDLTTTIMCWWSPELRLALYSIVDDPLKGVHKFEIKDLSRLEPSAGLWTIPEGYTVRPAVSSGSFASAR